jgi:hypothetical protein
VGTFFGGCGHVPAIVSIAFLNSPCYETPKNVIEKNRTKQPGEGKKQPEEKNPRIFCDEPRWAFWATVFFMFLNSPGYETPKKTQ